MTNTDPLGIRLTDDQVHEYSKPAVLSQGWYRFVTTNATAGLSKSEKPMITLQCNPLEDPEDAASKFSMAARVYIMIPNPSQDKYQSKAFFTHKTISGILGEDFPGFIEKNADGQSVYQNEVVERENYQAVKEAALSARTQRTADLYYDDVNAFLGSVFYAEIVHGDDGFVSIRNCTQELPEGTELVPAGNFVS